MILPDALFCVDAFTGRAGSGNPAGVCLLSGPKDPAWMQLVARELNLSETVFVVRDGAGFSLRWFTPRIEIELAGHPTLAAAHVLWQERFVPAGEPACFSSPSGPLLAEQTESCIELDFPAVPATEAPVPAGLAEALGINPRYIGKTKFDYLVEARSERELRMMRPDFRYLAGLPVRGIIVTARAVTPGIDVVSRFFAPAAGIDEDPVTGSAHCTLAPFWQERLCKDTLMAYQASERGGMLRLRVCGNGRVKIAGKAVTVWKGSLSI